MGRIGSDSDVPNKKEGFPMTLSQSFTLGVIVIVVVVLLLLSGQLFENLDADEVMVIQSPISGELAWYKDPGIKWQGGGKVTSYPKRSIYTFTIPVRFNDGGHADMVGSIQYEMPLDAQNLTGLHVRFGSPEAIKKQLIETVTNKCVYMTGPLMSSKESYAEKRNYLIRFVEDQIERGVYKTIQREARTKDQMTGADKTVTVVEVATKDGLPERQEEPVLTTFGIRTFNFAVTDVRYEKSVEDQIRQQQLITMDVQTAIADAKKAEQRAITVAKQGEADAAKARWEQEVIKAKAVTEAQQKLEVATLEARAAEQTKRAQTLLGEGEAARKRLVMEADGALEKKLDALIEVNKLYAQAIEKYQGNWVPSLVMGGNSSGSGTAGSGALTLIDLLTAKTARELGLDLGVAGAAKTKQK